ncbi:uncharacterized protein LOC115969839 [Quercus lobata]|nr:uncharacterized protein LOC115969839 [Quercus lobata]
MSDWGPVFVAVVLFILLTPGLLVQIPGKGRFIEFGNFQTSGASILVHSIIYFALMCIFLLAIGIHMYIGSYFFLNATVTPLASSSKSSENHFRQALLTFSNSKPTNTSFLSLTQIGKETTPSDRRGCCGVVFVEKWLLQRQDWRGQKMADWAPVLIGVVLFVLLQPGLLFQLPGHNRQLEFGSMKTNGKAIAIHTLIFFAIYAILILALHVHIYTG